LECRDCSVVQSTRYKTQQSRVPPAQATPPCHPSKTPNLLFPPNLSHGTLILRHHSPVPLPLRAAMSHPLTPGKPYKARASLPPKSTPTDRLKAARQRSLLRSEMGVLRSRQKRNASRPFASPGSALPSSSAGASGSSAMKRWLRQERDNDGSRALMAGSAMAGEEDAGSTMGDDAACLADVDRVGEEGEGAAEEEGGERISEGARKRRRLDGQLLAIAASPRGQAEGNAEGGSRRDSLVRRLWPGSGGEEGSGGGGVGERDDNGKGRRDQATAASDRNEPSDLRTENEHDYSADWGIVKVDDVPEESPASDLQLVLLNPREARRAGMVEEDARRWLAELKQTERRLPTALRHRPQEMLEWVAERHGAGGNSSTLPYFRRRLRMWRFLEFLSDYPAEARGVECVEAWCQAMVRQEEEEQGRMLGSWESDEEAGDEEDLDDDDWGNEEEEKADERGEEKRGEEQHAAGVGGEDGERERGEDEESSGDFREKHNQSKAGHRGSGSARSAGADGGGSGGATGDDTAGATGGGSGTGGCGGGGVPWWVAWHGQLSHPSVASRRRLLTRDLECQFASRGPTGRYSELPTYFRCEGGERRQLAIPLSRMLQQQRQLAMLRERDAQERVAEKRGETGGGGAGAGIVGVGDADLSLALVVAGGGTGKGEAAGGGRGLKGKRGGRGGRRKEGEQGRKHPVLQKEQTQAVGQEGHGMWYGGTGRAVGLGTAAEEAQLFAPIPVSADEVLCNAPGCRWGVPMLALPWLKCEKHWDKMHGGGESGRSDGRAGNAPRVVRREVAAEKLVETREEWERATRDSRDHVVSLQHIVSAFLPHRFFPFPHSLHLRSPALPLSLRFLAVHSHAHVSPLVSPPIPGISNIAPRLCMLSWVCSDCCLPYSRWHQSKWRCWLALTPEQQHRSSASWIQATCEKLPLRSSHTRHSAFKVVPQQTLQQRPPMQQQQSLQWQQQQQRGGRLPQGLLGMPSFGKGAPECGLLVGQQGREALLNSGAVAGGGEECM
ncbi:hypothetical protein CLOM_g12237, partial [Closterium sp. NIES-68]